MRRDIERRIEETEGKRQFLAGSERVPDFYFKRDPENELQVETNVAHRFVYHSPSGLEFGYAGSGPSDAALNILAQFIPLGEAWALHHQFKFRFVAPMPREGGVIKAEEVRAWISRQWEGSDGSVV